MAIKDIGKGLKGSIKEVTGAIKEKVKDAELPNLKEVGDNAQEHVKNLFQQLEEKKASKKSANTNSTNVDLVQGISVVNAIKTIYFLMAADGDIKDVELESFDSISLSLDHDFLSIKEQLIKECSESLNKAIDNDDYYESLKVAVDAALLQSERTNDTFITPKLLLWNLLSITYSDKKYQESERKLLKYIVRKLNINKADFLEMESSMLTYMDIQKEIDWIKTTDRPYLTIETMVNELTTRQNVIFESIKDLISL